MQWATKAIVKPSPSRHTLAMSAQSCTCSTVAKLWCKNYLFPLEYNYWLNCAFFTYWNLFIIIHHGWYSKKLFPTATLNNLKSWTHAFFVQCGQELVAEVISCSQTADALTRVLARYPSLQREVRQEREAVGSPNSQAAAQLQASGSGHQPPESTGSAPGWCTCGRWVVKTNVKHIESSSCTLVTISPIGSACFPFAIINIWNTCFVNKILLTTLWSIQFIFLHDNDRFNSYLIL